MGLVGRSEPRVCDCYVVYDSDTGLGVDHPFRKTCPDHQAIAKDPDAHFQAWDGENLMRSKTANAMVTALPPEKVKVIGKDENGGDVLYFKEEPLWAWNTDRTLTAVVEGLTDIEQQAVDAAISAALPVEDSAKVSMVVI